LTDKAVDFLNWFAPVHLKNIKHLMGVFTSEEKTQFVSLMDKLRAQMRKLGPLKLAERSKVEGAVQ